MDRIHDLAQLLVSSWSLAASQDQARLIPTSHGIFDRALKMVADEGLLPSWAMERLHFVDSRIGLQCVELPVILDWAQKSELTAAPNPSYRTTHVQVSPAVARKLLRRISVGEVEAQKLGQGLRDAFNQLHASLDSQALEDF
jgi:hypothetical protein